MEKEWYQKKHSKIMLVIIGILFLLLIVGNESNETKTDVENLQQENTIEYKYVKCTYLNNSKEKIDKIVADENITDEQAKQIYEDRKVSNNNNEIYKLWIYTSEENVENLEQYDIAEVKEENNIVIVTNYKRELEKKHEEEKIKEETKIQEQEESKEEIKQQENTKTVTIGEKNALSTAKSYLAYTAFSYEGLIKQLKFEGYSAEEATYGADNCGANWNEQAAKMARQYMDYSSFSRSGLIKQLKYEGFTSTQAEYGVSAVGY